jgi:hypothetical protein
MCCAAVKIPIDIIVIINTHLVKLNAPICVILENTFIALFSFALENGGTSYVIISA